MVFLHLLFTVVAYPRRFVMDSIDPEMTVAEVVDRHPETVDVFLRHDCPDMRRGLFQVMSHVMSVRWAAWIHDIPLDDLLRDLNEATGEDRPDES